MKVLLAPTEDFIKRQVGQLNADMNAGSSVVSTVINSDGFAVNDFVVVGEEGAEGSELCQITALTPTSMTFATVLLFHKKDEPLTKYRYNKRKFYGCTTLAGSYLELTSSGSPAVIAVTDPQGTYLEYTGLEGYIYFKSTYYNSTTAEETAIAESQAVAGDESIRYCSIFAIKKQAGLLKNEFINDGVVETYRRRAESEIDSYINTRYILPLENSSGVAEIPWLIENCTTLLAAGYMDYQEFGKEGEGVKWLGESRSILKKIRDGEQQLLGSDKQEMMAQDLTASVQGFPDQVDNKNGPTKKFTMNQIF